MDDCLKIGIKEVTVVKRNEKFDRFKEMMENVNYKIYIYDFAILHNNTVDLRYYDLV